MNMNNVIKFDKESCVHCNYCEVVCAKGCIKVVPDFEGERLHQTFDMYK